MSAPFVERTPLADVPPLSQVSTHSPPNSPRFPLSSLNSSLFLSEASSPVLHPSLNEDTSSKTLIIPSLTLPDTRHNNNAGVGEAIGNLRLWVMGRRSLGCKSAAESLVIGTPLVSEVNEWSTSSDGYPVLCASTIPLRDRDPLQSPDRERRRNVEIFVAEYEEHQEPQIILDSILSVIHQPFSAIDQLLNDSEPSTTSFIPLLTSSSTRLYTGFIFLLSPPSSQMDHTLMTELSAHVPLIPMPVPTLAPSHVHSRHAPAINLGPISSTATALSSLRPGSLLQLRDNIFHTPSTLEHLRTEAAERFLRWRDLNAALRHLSSSPSSSMLVSGTHTLRRRPQSDPSRPVPGGILQVSGIQPTFPSVKSPSDGSEWMWNWETRFSRDVHDSQMRPEGDKSTASYVRGDFSGHQRSPESVGGADSTQSHGDPLHLRSVARLAFSLMPALANKYLFRTDASAPGTRNTSSRPRRWGISWAVFGLGVGVGITVSLCIVGLRFGLGIL
ncbi:hypothetical protein BS47DRAFT_1341269 [Hydnum rufescens UP504]|uniref:Uncharacterized protein n=1 Tax=Hydnum rufescens UP504 TaxID=1448309 RepID=A0A9P6B235_9AGAM|nr:hypothetical protein BS47DRAFT_1341269 [Hydnum rufescens UP504]